MNFHLTTKAKEDLKNIALYTQEIWGIEQRDIANLAKKKFRSFAYCT